MIDTLTIIQLISVAAILAVAYIIRGVAGFGSGLIAVPLLTFILPLSLVVPLVVLLDYIASLSQGLKNREEIRWKELIPLIPFSIIGVVIALVFLSKVDTLLLTRALGVFIVVYAIYTLSVYSPKKGTARGWVYWPVLQAG